MSDFDDYVLTQQQVDLAEKRLQECKENLGEDLVVKKFYTWVSNCLAHITFIHTCTKKTVSKPLLAIYVTT